MRHAVEQNRAADDGRIGAVARAPQRVGEDDRVATPRVAGVGCERAAERRVHAEHREDVRRHERHDEARRRPTTRLRRIPAGDRHLAPVLRAGQAPIRAALRDEDVVDAERNAPFGPDLDEARGRGVRQRLEQHAVHDAKDRSVGADA